MALSPELKRMVLDGQVRHADPLEAKRAEILARLADDEREFAMLSYDDCRPSIRDRLARLGLERATKQELREIIMDVMMRNADA
ncbi:hypothetical protein C8J36_102621 [Rhizobium sp. PP-F2F-G48]|uniref:hypothetical protein n=1 Tax=Rhizobium sp. PP-F2F-G48 TaxID=2135651 RepID=UPI0010518EE8|nr:hypothetical protein [Rhizobium sp. PP-F2F-G48]TCM57818.1 hypothetical protein C8J36_102621 [Rhizobium sp. PP-F2F-G48]